MPRRKQQDDFAFGLDRLPLPALAVVIASAVVLMVSAVVHDPSWLQIVFVFSISGLWRIWRLALLRRTQATKRELYGE